MEGAGPREGGWGAEMEEEEEERGDRRGGPPTPSLSSL